MDERDPPTEPADNSSSTSPTATAPPSSADAREVGPYRLYQKIGEGGMGEVWLAEQTAPLRRRVAFKVIRQGGDTKQIIARFEAERQALALMSHRAVAKVFDAGSTPDGRPYLVMEYVQGVAITEYCDRERLTTPERLELFIQVCEGVQHAHQKAIIHRDLKPSNVLVTIEDGRALPKIIDFGVAKATGHRLTEKTLYTELGTLIGTPDYMSPEQAEMTGQDVDTRTDVYSLGVILYELLTGVLPFDPKELRSGGFDGIRRKIREQDPQKPSARVSTLRGECATESGRKRRVDSPTLGRQLRGDLDWITMRSLEKDRTRRYGSPSELAADVRRHLEHQPVLAGRPGTLYRARKFVRRHRYGVAMAAIAVLALVALAAGSAVQARRIARERDRAERVTEFLVGLFRVSDPEKARGSTITAREVLDRGAEKIDRELGGEPQLQAQLMQTMGSVYFSLGMYSKSQELFARAVELRKRVLGPDHADTLGSMNSLARAYWGLGRYQDAEVLHREALEVRRRVLGPEHPDTLRSITSLAIAYFSQGRFQEAEKLHREALEVQRRVLGPEDPLTLSSADNLAIASARQGRYQEAEKLHREALEVRRRVLGSEHPDTLASINNLANVCVGLGRYDEADKLHRETLEVRRRVLGPKHPQTLNSEYNLACVAAVRGRRGEALGFLRQAVGHGFRNADWLAKDPDLASLHGDPEFERLLTLARANAKE